MRKGVCVSVRLDTFCQKDIFASAFCQKAYFPRYTNRTPLRLSPPPMECLRGFRRGSDDGSLKNRVGRAVERTDTSVVSPKPESNWTLHSLLASAFFCRGPPSADKDDPPPGGSSSRAEDTRPRSSTSASVLGGIPETDDAASSADDPPPTRVETVEVSVSGAMAKASRTRRPPNKSIVARVGIPDKHAKGVTKGKLAHRRSWSWSMQWSAGEGNSDKKRRRHESAGERGTRAPAEARDFERDGFDDLWNPGAGAGAASVDDASATSLATATLTSTAPIQEGTGAHSRSGSWSDGWAVGGVTAGWFSSSGKTATEKLAAKTDKKDKKDAAKATQKQHALASELLRKRAAREDDQLQRVMEETAKAHLYSLPRRRSVADEHAACVLVTPARNGKKGDDGNVSPPTLFRRDTSVSVASAGTWVDVELRGTASLASSSCSSDKSEEYRTRGTDGEWGIAPFDPSSRKIRASAFFASYDQRGAAGEGSCTLVCVALAEWLAANPGRLPTETLVSGSVGNAVRGGGCSGVDFATAEEVLDDELVPTPAKQKSLDDARLVFCGDASSPPSTPDGAQVAVTPTRGQSVAGRPPVKPRFVLDALMAGAAREWRALCLDPALVKRFPDKHFDLDTAAALHTPFSVAAEASRNGTEDTEHTEHRNSSEHRNCSVPSTDTDEKRISAVPSLARNKNKATPYLLRAAIHHGDSFVGFLRPPGVHKGDSPTLDALSSAAPPLLDIVEQLAKQAPATFAVSWNDHFFTLHFRHEELDDEDERNHNQNERDETGGAKGSKQKRPRKRTRKVVAYVIDSLGERLCEGCRRGYVLRFDENSLRCADTYVQPPGVEGGGIEKEGSGIETRMESRGGGGDKKTKSTKKTKSDASAVAAAIAAFIGDVLPSRALRELGVSITNHATGSRNATEPDPETLMRRLQIEFHRVETNRG